MLKPDVREAILKNLTDNSQVEEIFECHYITVGRRCHGCGQGAHAATDSKKVRMDINEVEKGLKAQFPQVKWIFFEPDVNA